MADVTGGGSSSGLTQQSLDDLAWNKNFFELAGLLPANILVENSREFPEPDDSGGSNCTITRLRSRCEFNSAASPGRGTVLWDAGATKSSMLFVVAESFSKAWVTRIFLASALDANKEVSTGYSFEWSRQSQQWNLYTWTTGTFTLLASLPQELYNTMFGLALWFDGTTVIGLTRTAGGCWWPVFQISNSVHSALRYAGLTHIANVEKTYSAAPVVVRHS